MPEPIDNFNFIEGVNLDDSSFTQDEILEAQAHVRQYLEDKYKNVGFSPTDGVFDLVVRPMAQIWLVSRKFVDEFTKSRTLEDALANNGSKEVVDALLSNFLVKRNDGARAIGTVKVTIEDASVNQNITAGSIFQTLDGHQYSVESTLRASLSGGDIQIYRGPGNSGYFMVKVQSVENGSKFNIKKDTQFQYSGTIFGFVNATALSEFSGGVDDESNQSVYNRIFSSMSARNMASPVAIQQTLRDNFGSITQVTPHGVYSQFMSRNSDGIFGSKTGCCSDVYVKTAKTPEVRSFRLIAKKLTPDSEEYSEFAGNFIVRVSEALFPGHYDVLSVKKYSTDLTIGSLQIERIIRRFRNQDTAPNRFSLIEEVAFSPHSYTDVIFSEGPAQSGLDEIAVTCDVLGLPDIKEISDFVNSGSKQSMLIDTLIRACVPCFVGVEGITIRVNPDSPITQQMVETVVSDYITSIDPIKDEPRVDGIIHHIMSLEGVRSVDPQIRITARVLPPTREYESLEFNTYSTLYIPDNHEKKVGMSTIGFFCSPSAVSVKIQRQP